jgi:adenine-specific DNA-methyltransferase
VLTLHCGDALAFAKTLPDASVDLIATDPPYFKVKNEPWDRQWEKPEEFLSWLGEHLAEWRRILKPNGSLYVFASPKLAARVEVLTADAFNVLNRIRWVKEAGWHNKAKKEELRSFLSPWEEVIFAEQYGADSMALGESGYAAQCEKLHGFIFEPLRSYLDGERKRAGVGKDECNEACGFSRSMGGMASRHYFSSSQWCLPTAEHYAKLQALFNRSGGDYLRREYEDLRREYEDLRRFFSVTSDVPYTDVWTFKTVNSYPGKHACEKPLSLMEHIIRSSSRPGAVVFDPFMGSGTTGVAAVKLARDFIGCDLSEHWVKISRESIANEDRSQQLPLAA